MDLRKETHDKAAVPQDTRALTVTTIVTATNSNGTTGRCDAKCHDAKGVRCNCICGGVFHGVSPPLITEHMWSQFWAHMTENHPGTLVNLKPIQLPLPGIPERQSLNG